MYSCLFRSWNVQLEPIDYTSRCFSWEFSCKYIWVQAAFLPPSELEDTRPTWQRASWLAFGKKTSSSSSTKWFWFWEFLQPSFWVFKLEDPSKNLWFPSFPINMTNGQIGEMPWALENLGGPPGSPPLETQNGTRGSRAARARPSSDGPGWDGMIYGEDGGNWGSGTNLNMALQNGF